jgi:hypothetical protein
MQSRGEAGVVAIDDKDGLHRKQEANPEKST